MMKMFYFGQDSIYNETIGLRVNPVIHPNMSVVQSVSREARLGGKAQAGSEFCQITLKLFASKSDILIPKTDFSAILDTGAQTSIIMGELAGKLGINPNSYRERIILSLMGNRFLAGTYEMHIYLADGGSNPVVVPICVPIFRVPGGAIFRQKYLRENLIGMCGVLSRMMLCITPSTVFFVPCKMHEHHCCVQTQCPSFHVAVGRNT